MKKRLSEMNSFISEHSQNPLHVEEFVAKNLLNPSDMLLVCFVIDSIPESFGVSTFGELSKENLQTLLSAIVDLRYRLENSE